MRMNKAVADAPASLLLLVLAALVSLVSLSVGATGLNQNAELDTNLDLDLEEDEGEYETISSSSALNNGTIDGKLDEGDESAIQIFRGNQTEQSAYTLKEKLHELTVTDSSDANVTIDAEHEKPEQLPEAMELRYIRPTKYRRRPLYSIPTRRSSVNRRNVYTDKPVRQLSRTTKRPSDPKRAPTESECTFFSKTVCLEAADYPIEAILRSIRNNKDMVDALLADFKLQDGGFNEDEDISHSPYKINFSNRYEKGYESRLDTSNEIKRKYEFSGPFDDAKEGYTCPSQVKYARPQLARAASGIWKYIINTGEHTQTLRLEKCTNPRASCSFISENYRSSCMQVYNYHRLLTWDSKLGLHMDIFKVPTCCSCHVHGYTDLYPPHQTDPPFKNQELFPGVDFATNEHHSAKGSSHINKYANSLDSSALNLFRESYGSSGSDQDEPQLQHSSSARRPSIARPSRPRKPGPGSRPFDKLPQQHAPNTRAPGYKGPRPHRPNRPFRRESTAQEAQDYSENTSNITVNRFSQALEQDPQMETSLRLQNGGFDDEYHEPQRRINYNYHPIIDFFKPEAAMLKSEKPVQVSQSITQMDNDSWKPIFKQ